jgi:hypothetical protein
MEKVITAEQEALNRHKAAHEADWMEDVCILDGFVEALEIIRKTRQPIDALLPILFRLKCLQQGGRARFTMAELAAVFNRSQDTISEARKRLEMHSTSLKFELGEDNIYVVSVPNAPAA